MRDLMAYLSRNPSAMIRYQASGRQPNRIRRRKTPVMQALESIGPRYRAALRSFTIDQRLGYRGRRTFATAENAYGWLGGDKVEQFEGEPRPAADSWIIKNYTGPVTWEALRACTGATVSEAVAGGVRRMLAAGGRPVRG